MHRRILGDLSRGKLRTVVTLNSEKLMQPNDQLPVTPTPEPQPAPVPQQPEQAQPPIPQAEPPKKSRKKLIITLAVLIPLVLIALFFGLRAYLTSEADKVSAGYSEKVLTHVKAIREGPTEKDRVDQLEKKLPAIPEVWMGTTLSTQYKDAKELEQRYTTLLDETTPFFKEVYTFLDFANYQDALNKELAVRLADPSDDASYVQSIRDKAKRINEFADRLEAYYFDPAHSDLKKNAVANLREMAKSYTTSADIKAGDTENQSELDASNNTLVKNLEEYRSFVQGQSFKSYIDDMQVRLVKESGDVDDRFEALINELEK